MSIILLIIGLVLFVALVVVHELGHFIVARRNGVEAEEFGIGFPPKVWSKRVKSDKGDYDFSINALPLGGFVRLKGEHDADAGKGSFGAASLWVKVKIMMAGVLMNLLTAFVLLTALAFIGMPKLIDNQFTVKQDEKIARRTIFVGFVEEGSPAEKAGLQVRDELASIGPVNGAQRTIDTKEALPKFTEEFAGQEVSIQYRRGGELASAKTTLLSAEDVEASRLRNDRKGYLGVSPLPYEVSRYSWSSPIVAGGLIKQFTELTYTGLGRALGGLFTGNTKQASEQVSGPVGIFVILKEGTTLGYGFILMIIAVLSLTLAIMNSLPIPALDGGRLFVTLLYRALRRPLTPKAEEWIHGTGFAALMILFVLITVVDVKRFF